MHSEKKDLVLNFLKGLSTGNPDPLSFINPKYIQHNLSSPDGVEGLKGVLEHLPLGAINAKVVRIFEDGNFIFTHSDYDFFGPKIGFDIFRLQNGKISEHWDNLQTTAGPNESGHSMVDGATVLEDLEKTEANKNIIKNFLNNVLIGHQMERLAEYLEKNFIQHNPMIGDGIDGLTFALQTMNEHKMPVKMNKVETILGEGNFVLSVSEGSVGEKATTFYDLFRLKNNKITEHWDVLEPLLLEAEWENKNGKFGF